ncbi:MAG: response regulator [Actinobacteria bacterium]|jgi:putative two-component system response regulator|nr:response regulator [Actinomycetota bacterium]
MTEPVHPDARVLVVDDEGSIVRLLTRALEDAGYTSIVGFTDPVAALAYTRNNTSDLIVLDINMPGMSGYDFLNDLSQHLNEDTFLPVLMVSGLPEAETRLRALKAGAVNFLSKPIDLDVFIAHVHSLLETRYMSLRLYEVRGVLEELVRRRTAQLQQAHVEILDRLARVAEYRDDATGQHTDRVGHVCSQLARELGLPQETVTLIGRTSPLHDLGKVAIPDVVLLKRGAFDDAEREAMRKHSALGAKLLSGGTSELVQMAEEIALYHHERWDGTGYPSGLQADEIPLTARIVAVADAFDALTHERPYKEAWSVSAALQEIERERGGQFDPRVVDALITLHHEKRLNLPEDKDHGY